MKLITLLLLLPSLAFSQNYKKEATEILNNAFNNGPGCAAMVSVKGAPEYSYCTGKANVELDVPMKMEHKFRIGSLTKQFTAIGIMILVEQGKLKVSDTIQKYLPTFPEKEHVITIEHLLTHTSGIKSYTDPKIMDETFMRLYHSPKELVKSFSEFPLEFEPGSKFSYSNSGYHLLGLIIEKASGKSYRKFLKKEIFDKAGMNDSRTDSDKEIIPNRISGYDPMFGPANAQHIDMSIPYSAGNILSTVSDLNLWYKALFNYEIVQKETLEKAHSEYKLTNGEMSDYGYGWIIRKIEGEKAVIHSGGIPGFLSFAIYFPNQNMLSVILSNCTCNNPAKPTMEIAKLAIKQIIKKD